MHHTLLRKHIFKTVNIHLRLLQLLLSITAHQETQRIHIDRGSFFSFFEGILISASYSLPSFEKSKHSSYRFSGTRKGPCIPVLDPSDSLVNIHTFTHYTQDLTAMVEFLSVDTTAWYNIVNKMVPLFHW